MSPERKTKILQMSFTACKEGDEGSAFQLRKIPPHFQAGFTGHDVEEMASALAGVRESLVMTGNEPDPHSIGRAYDKLEQAMRFARASEWGAQKAINHSAFLQADLLAPEVTSAVARKEAIPAWPFLTIIDTEWYRQAALGKKRFEKGVGRVQVRHIKTGIKNEVLQAGVVIHPDEHREIPVLPRQMMGRCINMASRNVIGSFPYPDETYAFGLGARGMRVLRRLYRGGKTMYLNTHMIIPLYYSEKNILCCQPILVGPSARLHAFYSDVIGNPWRNLLSCLDPENNQDSLPIEEAIAQIKSRRQ